MTSAAAPPPTRAQLRAALRAERERFAAGPGAAAAQAALARHLVAVVQRLEPSCLGLYWPVRSEFNAPIVFADETRVIDGELALPFSRRVPRAMHYRRWDGALPTLLDECAIPACEGAELVPDVVLAPCVGFTPEGYRLGYGGGYFDRWLAAHPGVTVIGVAWAFARIDTLAFNVQPHDLPMMAVVTELGVV